MCEENVKRSGDEVGEVVMTEDPMLNGMIRRSFARAMVMVTFADRCVVAKAGIRSTNVSSNSATDVVGLAMSQGCERRRDPSVPRYGAWTGVSTARNWEDAIVIHRKDWEEAEAREDHMDIAHAQEDRDGGREHHNQNNGGIGGNEVDDVRMEEANEPEKDEAFCLTCDGPVVGDVGPGEGSGPVYRPYRIL